MPKFAHVEPWMPPRVTSVHVDPWTMPPRGKSVHVEHTSTWQIGTRGSKFQIRLRPLPANTQLFIANAGDFILQPISPLCTSDISDRYCDIGQILQYRTDIAISVQKSDVLIYEFGRSESTRMDDLFSSRNRTDIAISDRYCDIGTKIRRPNF